MIIDGRKISSDILAQLKTEVAKFTFTPKLIDVVVGNDPVTESYVKIKAKKAGEIGIDFELVHLDENISQEDLEKEILRLNKTENLCGLIIQLPLPAHLDKQKVVDLIDPEIDVDVITSVNAGRLFTGQAKLMPATAGAIMKVLESTNVSLEGKHVLVIGAGDLVGKPTSFILMQRKATVTVANEQTVDLKNLCQQAEIIISGTGVPKLVTADMVAPEAIIIDAGTAESAGGISGDADFEMLKDKVAGISPVPGGVGPVTVAMLLHNVVEVAKTKKTR
jgi:methylenetetrahydrofolate dehydrogenase (NADP+)/methenyltetrahydrofolate cyclohydrolase